MNKLIEQYIKGRLFFFLGGIGFLVLASVLAATITPYIWHLVIPAPLIILIIAVGSRNRKAGIALGTLYTLAAIAYIIFGITTLFLPGIIRCLFGTLHLGCSYFPLKTVIDDKPVI